VETKCGSGWFNAANSNLRCQENVVESKCGEGWYDATNTELRCPSGVLEAKCGSLWYDALNTNLRCENNVVETECGSGWYNSLTHSCTGGVAVKDEGEFTDARGDSETYKWVRIGTQRWMAENLNYAAEGSKCYSNNETNCTTYGRLYDWATAMALPGCGSGTSCGSRIGANHQGVCPNDWHIPSDAEWDVLMTAVGGSFTAGQYLKATSGWYNCGPSGSGSGYLCEDAFGFSALPGGLGYSDGSFGPVGNDGDWWSATESDASSAYGRDMYSSDANVRMYGYDKTTLFSVRCVQD
jgi:uncharacterized protein (TIGR02145 family)